MRLCSLQTGNPTQTTKNPPKRSKRVPKPLKRQPKPMPATPKPLELGDMVENALTSVGITSERVTAWLGRPCGCVERKEKLNNLSRWAKRVVSGSTEKAEEYLEEMIDGA